MHKQARFYTDYKGSIVKLTIKKGDQIVLHEQSETDEGFSFVGVVFEFDGDILWQYRTSGGQDCDGYQSTSSDMFCAFDNLRMGYLEEKKDENGKLVSYPKWELDKERCFDQFAQNMNY